MSKKPKAPRKQNVNEVVNESQVEVVNETQEEPVKETQEEPVKETQEEPVKETSRQVKVFWHKSCLSTSKVTLTTLRVDETLRLTNGLVTIDEKPLPVYSLKRGKRIYYLYDVTPNDIVKAALRQKEIDTLKENERLAKEALGK